MCSLVLVFSKCLSKVLMVKDIASNKYSLFYTKTKSSESIQDSAYRTVSEKAGISKTDIDLNIFRYERVNLYRGSKSWKSSILCGVISKDIPLSNDLLWIDVSDVETLLKSGLDGSCYTYVLQALRFIREGKVKY